MLMTSRVNSWHAQSMLPNNKIDNNQYQLPNQLIWEIDENQWSREL